MKKIFFILIFALCLFVGKSFAQTEPSPTPEVTPTVESNVDGTVCLSREEAKAIYSLAEKGRKFDKYAEKAEADIKERDSIIVDLKLKYATAVQDTINLSNEKRERNAELEQYRQYFFQNPPKKCKFSFICNQK